MKYRVKKYNTSGYWAIWNNQTRQFEKQASEINGMRFTLASTNKNYIRALTKGLNRLDKIKGGQYETVSAGKLEN